MNCIEFEIAVESAVEKRQPLDSTILEHTKSCPGCQVLLDVQQRLDSAIAAWRIAEPPAGLVDSVLEELARPVLVGAFDDRPNLRDVHSGPHDDLLPTSYPVRTSQGIAATNKNRSNGLAIAAMSVCLLFATVLLFQTSQRRPFDLAQRQRADTALDLPGTLTAVLSDLKSEYRGMASETTSAAREMVNAIPHPETLAKLPETDDFQLNQAPDEMVRILKPIGSQVGSALGFLWKAMPSEIPSG